MLNQYYNDDSINNLLNWEHLTMYDQIINTVTSHKHNGTNSTPQPLEEAWIDVHEPKVYPTITIYKRGEIGHEKDYQPYKSNTTDVLGVQRRRQADGVSI